MLVDTGIQKKKKRQKCARNKVHISNKEDNSSLENIYVE